MTAPTIATIIVAFITAVAGPAAIEILKRKLTRKDVPDDMDRELESDTIVTEQLEELLKKLECDRVWILQFHNGGHFYSSGVSIKKFSFFYELVSLGTSKIQQQFQNVPTSFFSKTLKQLNETNSIQIDDISDDNIPNYGVRDVSEQSGCKAVFMSSLKTPNGKFHGVLGVDYVKDTHQFTPADVSTINVTSAYVSGILSTIHHK